LKILLTRFPDDHEAPDQHPTRGLEPWDLEAVMKALGIGPGTSAKQLGSAQVLRERGPAFLTPEQRAFWLQYQQEVASSLPLTTEGTEDITDEAQAAVQKFLALKPDASQQEALADEMEKTASSLVQNEDGVALYARRGTTRVCTAANDVLCYVSLNTKARSTEVVSCGHHKVLSLTHAVPGFTRLPIVGHRYRVRYDGIPAFRDIYQLLNCLRSALVVPVSRK
jgi:hypothetical protein